VAENTASGLCEPFFIPMHGSLRAAIDSIVLRNPARDETRHVFSAKVEPRGAIIHGGRAYGSSVWRGSSHLASCLVSPWWRAQLTSGEVKSLTLPQLQYSQEQDLKRFKTRNCRRQTYRESLAKAEERPSLDEIPASQKNCIWNRRKKILAVFAPEILYWSPPAEPIAEQENVPKTIFGDS